MSDEIGKETAASLMQGFGYVPDQPGGEKWVAFEDRLIVIHPERRPRIYKLGGQAVYFEIDVSFG